MSFPRHRKFKQKKTLLGLSQTYGLKSLASAAECDNSRLTILKAEKIGTGATFQLIKLSSSFFKRLFPHKERLSFKNVRKEPQ